jgi:hypothetical protein
VAAGGLISNIFNDVSSAVEQFLNQTSAAFLGIEPSLVQLTSSVVSYPGQIIRIVI